MFRSSWGSLADLIRMKLCFVAELALLFPNLKIAQVTARAPTPEHKMEPPQNLHSEAAPFLIILVIINEVYAAGTIQQYVRSCHFVYYESRQFWY